MRTGRCLNGHGQEWTSEGECCKFIDHTHESLLNGARWEGGGGGGDLFASYPTTSTPFATLAISWAAATKRNAKNTKCRGRSVGQTNSHSEYAEFPSCTWEDGSVKNKLLSQLSIYSLAVCARDAPLRITHVRGLIGGHADSTHWPKEARSRGRSECCAEDMCAPSTLQRLFKYFCKGQWVKNGQWESLSKLALKSSQWKESWRLKGTLIKGLI